MAAGPQIYVKEFYQNIFMEQPIAPGVYPWKQVPPTAIRPMLDNHKAEWVGKPPKEFLLSEAEEAGVDEPPPPDLPDFFEMNVGELKDYAAGHGIAIPSSTRKREDIVAIIEAFYVVKESDSEQLEDQDEGDD